jgi:hypothetical protein
MKTIGEAAQRMFEQLGLKPNEIKKLIKLMKKDPDKLTEKEKQFLEENYNKLLNEIKRELLKNKDYKELEKIAIEEIRRMDDNQKENMRSHIASNMNDNPAKRKEIDIKISEHQKDIFTNYFNKPGGMDIFNKGSIDKWIEKMLGYEKDALDNNNPSCNITMSGEGSKLGVRLPLYDKGTKQWTTAQGQITYIREMPMIFKEITVENNSMFHQTAYNLAISDPDRAVFVAIETTKGPWHIGIINPNVPMEKSGSFNGYVPQIYSYVPTITIKDKTIPSRIDTAPLGYHVNPREVVRIQYFQYQGTVIINGDYERYVPRKKGAK